MPRDFGPYSPSLTTPIEEWVEVTPSDTAISPRPRALWVETSGAVVMEDTAGTTETFTLPTGLHPFRPSKIKSGTTATVYALY